MDDQDTNQQVIERYRVMPEEIRNLFDLGIIDRAVTIATQEFGLSEERRIALGNQIALVVLLFLPKSGFDSRLVTALDIGTEKAKGIVNVVESEVFALVDDILEEANDRFLDQKVGETDNISDEATPTPSENLQPAPESAPEPQSDTSITALRTMQGDANRIHGYGAYRRQPEQPKPNANGTKPLVEPPRYVEIDENEK